MGSVRMVPQLLAAGIKKPLSTAPTSQSFLYNDGTYGQIVSKKTQLYSIQIDRYII